MADIMLTLGGKYRYNGSTCRQQTYDSIVRTPRRIAGEYHHGLFTAGNSFNPMFSVGQGEGLEKYAVGVGDFIGLFNIPQEHTILDVAAKVIPEQKERGLPVFGSSDGLSFTVEIRKYDRVTLEQTGTLELVEDMSSILANTDMMKRSPIKPDTLGYFVPQGEILVLGLKVDSLPSDSNMSIWDVSSRVEVTAHVLDYEAPIHV